MLMVVILISGRMFGKGQREREDTGPFTEVLKVNLRQRGALEEAKGSR